MLYNNYVYFFKYFDRVFRSTLTAVKWLQADSQLLHLMSDGGDMKAVPSLARLVEKGSKHLNETPTVPSAEKVCADCGVGRLAGMYRASD